MAHLDDQMEQFSDFIVYFTNGFVLSAVSHPEFVNEGVYWVVIKEIWFILLEKLFEFETKSSTL